MKNKIFTFFCLGFCILFFQNCSSSETVQTGAQATDPLGSNISEPPPPLTRTGEKYEIPNSQTMVINADPQSLSSQDIQSLIPGGILKLAPGTYDPIFVRDLAGRADDWIIIESEDPQNPAIFQGNPNANNIDLRGSSYLAIRNIQFDGMNNGASFGISASTSPSHHILVEACDFFNFSGHQQQVAISSKVTVFNWIIRQNQILDAGTGLYLGNSTGSAPFIAGTIENNLVTNTIGYNMQIKQQNDQANVSAEQPTTPQVTIIRDNVFIKGDAANQAAPGIVDGPRPNLLVGGFPDSGTGSTDYYDVYRNFFFDNKTGDGLFQATGRVRIHHNLFVDSSSTALTLPNHQGKVTKVAHVFNNTFYGVPQGVAFSEASADNRLVGNIIFADSASSGPTSESADNISASSAQAGQYVQSPSSQLGTMNFTPLAGQCTGAALNLQGLSGASESALDFDLKPVDPIYRGAYTSDSTQNRWTPASAVKTIF